MEQTTFLASKGGVNACESAERIDQCDLFLGSLGGEELQLVATWTEPRSAVESLMRWNRLELEKPPLGSETATASSGFARVDSFLGGLTQAELQSCCVRCSEETRILEPQPLTNATLRFAHIDSFLSSLERSELQRFSTTAEEAQAGTVANVEGSQVRVAARPEELVCQARDADSGSIDHFLSSLEEEGGVRSIVDRIAHIDSFLSGLEQSELQAFQTLAEAAQAGHEASENTRRSSASRPKILDSFLSGLDRSELQTFQTLAEAAQAGREASESNRRSSASRPKMLDSFLSGLEQRPELLPATMPVRPPAPAREGGPGFIDRFLASCGEEDLRRIAEATQATVQSSFPPPEGLAPRAAVPGLLASAEGPPLQGTGEDLQLSATGGSVSSTFSSVYSAAPMVSPAPPAELGKIHHENSGMSVEAAELRGAHQDAELTHRALIAQLESQRDSIEARCAEQEAELAHFRRGHLQIEADLERERETKRASIASSQAEMELLRVQLDVTEAARLEQADEIEKHVAQITQRSEAEAEKAALLLRAEQAETELAVARKRMQKRMEELEGDCRASRRESVAARKEKEEAEQRATVMAEREIANSSRAACWWCIVEPPSFRHPEQPSFR